MRMEFSPITSRDGELAEPRENRGLQVVLGHRRRQIDVGVGDGVEQRANELRPADRGAALRADVRREPIEEDDLAVEQHDGDLGPCLVVYGRPAGLPLRGGGPPGRRENVGGGFGSFRFAAPGHSDLRGYPGVTPDGIIPSLNFRRPCS